MFDIFIERLRQKHRTAGYPAEKPTLPDRFRGRPFIHADRCLACRGTACGACAGVCPTAAIALSTQAVEGPALDMGACTFCGLCQKACPAGAIHFSRDWRLGSTSREALVIRPAVLAPAPEDEDPYLALPAPVMQPDPELRALFKMSLRLRQVSAAGCNACEADLNVLGTLVFDLPRFGIDFVASPRHADALALTGPVARNMTLALQKCARATPDPKFVIATGACAISGGLFRSLPGKASTAGAEGCPMPVQLYIPGCPPHPYTSLDAFLRFLGRI